MKKFRITVALLFLVSLGAGITSNTQVSAAEANRYVYGKTPVTELNRGEVKKIWAEYIGLDEGAYTPESWANMHRTIGLETNEKNALGIVKQWANRPDTSYISTSATYTIEMIQKEIDTAVASLRSGIDSLVSKTPVSPTLPPSNGISESLFRVYNKNNGEHFYTNKLAEKNGLVALGWSYEGIGWDAPKTGKPVYRVYNPNSGEHHYTVNAAEIANLIKLGWENEGIGWYSLETSDTPVYRLFNPNAKNAGSHHYTINKAEVDNLQALGWKYEGIGWYAV